MQDFGVGKEGHVHGGETGGKGRGADEERANMNEDGVDIGL